jgi:hypothetical protein
MSPLVAKQTGRVLPDVGSGEDGSRPLRAHETHAEACRDGRDDPTERFDRADRPSGRLLRVPRRSQSRLRTAAPSATCAAHQDLCADHRSEDYLSALILFFWDVTGPSTSLAFTMRCGSVRGAGLPPVEVAGHCG